VSTTSVTTSTSPAEAAIRSRSRGTSASPGPVVFMAEFRLTGRTELSTALAEPSSALEAVTRRAARCTSRLALPIAMLNAECANISTSLAASPIVAMASGGIPYLVDMYRADRALVGVRMPASIAASLVSPSRLAMTSGPNRSVADSRATWAPFGSGRHQSGPRWTQVPWPNDPIRTATGTASSSSSTRCSTTDMSGLTSRPPLQLLGLGEVGSRGSRGSGGSACPCGPAPAVRRSLMIRICDIARLPCPAL
jgi:hypothetical protein